ncbi:ribonuclease P protein component [Foetidibacter luteolus]|uniref:ribonuclease P protein component n=1 Tax=Foetidibacter luteolus TaxID=2608880 RepID=UPI00129B97DA|nr:ribonuclease P protein component [Foetidibacter luteolus]
MKANAYPKEEKLKGRKLVQQVFGSGKSFVVFPLKVFYTVAQQPLGYAVKAGVGASSRSFKKAVERNRIKRLLREVYRLNKQPLHQVQAGNNLQLAFFILYIDKVMPQQALLQSKMQLVIQRLIKELHEVAAENT